MVVMKNMRLKEKAAFVVTIYSIYSSITLHLLTTASYAHYAQQFYPPEHQKKTGIDTT